MLEALPEALVVCDPSGKIVLVNARTEFLFHHHRSELIGKPVEILMPERLREQHAGQRHLYEQSGANEQPHPMSQRAQLVGLRKDGLEIQLSITLSRMIEPRGPLSIILIRNELSRDRRSITALPGILQHKVGTPNAR